MVPSPNSLSLQYFCKYTERSQDPSASVKEAEDAEPRKRQNAYLSDNIISVRRRTCVPLLRNGTPVCATVGICSVFPWLQHARPAKSISGLCSAVFLGGDAHWKQLSERDGRFGGWLRRSCSKRRRIEGLGWGLGSGSGLHVR